MEKECLSERMNCFNHDNDHWRTPPLWTSGPFCFCMNANNNTYSCIRTINATHNFLYCEFVTGLITYYNLRLGRFFWNGFLCHSLTLYSHSSKFFFNFSDPFEQWNRVHTLNSSELSYLKDQLAQLKACRGNRQCTVGSAATGLNPPTVSLPVAAPSVSRTGAPSRANGKKRKFQQTSGELV